MGPGERFPTLPRRWRRWMAALATVAATTGCGDRPAKTAIDAAPLPRYWHGSAGGANREAWAVGPWDSSPSSASPSGALLPPEELPADEVAAVEPAIDAVSAPLTMPLVTPIAAPPPVDGAPTGAVVTERAAARIRRGYELAERGASFAARSEFVAALRMIAEAKDQLHGSARRTIALADGLRALEEAEDFSPLGRAAAAELSLSVIVSSHRTPAAKDFPVDALLPQQLADAYFRYAQVQLGAAVAGEPAGSMALHALGKLATWRGRMEPAANPQADRAALALQNAALLARNDNHFAAHELGVLLAESGHFVESAGLLRQVAANAPDAVVFRNLARIERQLGRPDLASLSERQATMLASRGADGGNVQWVRSDVLARTPDAMGPPGSRTPAAMIARGPAPMMR